MKHIRPITLALVLFSSLIPRAASADGGFFVLDEFWDMHLEERQYCAINYIDGIQKMIMAVDVANDIKGEEAVWIFPIPAKPENVKIDVTRVFPQFSGRRIEREARNTISCLAYYMQLTQLYPAPYVSRKLIRQMFGESGIAGLTVHETVVKLGLTSELISAHDDRSFMDYLTKRGLDLPKSFQPILDSYIGQEYAFMISWISDMDEFKRVVEEANTNRIGVFLEFPTEKIYYPLKPTSVYGTQTVPASIFVLDYVKPELFPEIQAYTRVDYFIARSLVVPKELQGSDGQETPVERYTKLEIDAPSELLVQDLWLEDSWPLGIRIAHYVNTFSFFIVILVICSCLASMIAGISVYRGNDIPAMKFALLGLSNCLSLLGLIIASTIFLKLRGVKLLFFFLAFTISFMILTYILQFLVYFAFMFLMRVLA